MGQHYKRGLAIALAALVAGCGGGDGASGPAARTEAADVRTQALSTPAQDRTAPVAVRPAPNVDTDDSLFVPDELPPGTGDPCKTDADFARMPAAWQDALPGLASRHVFCLVYKAEPSSFPVYLVRKKNGSWRLTQPADGSGDGQFVIGTGEVETRVQLFGKPNELVKTLRIQQRILNFVKADGYPGPRRHNIVTRPKMRCFSVGSNGGCMPTAAMPTLKVPFGGRWSPAVDIPLTFRWTKDNLDPEVDYMSFEVHLDAFDMAVSGAPLGDFARGEWTVYNIPQVRCDRGMAVGGGSGCVFPDAAPVLKLSRLDDDVDESAQHIFEAQQGLSPGMPDKAPGAFKLKPGTRAVADDSVKGLFLWLTRQKSSMPGFGSNRKESCHKADSIIMQRPNASASCPITGEGCDCDEYPYNATWEGGAILPLHTSAKYINKTDNRESGRRMKDMLHRERVLDFSTPDAPNSGEPFWVQID